METDLLSQLSRISDEELLAKGQSMARCESNSTAGLVAWLAEFDARQLYLDQGCASLFTYCVQILHLSEDATYARMKAARVVRKHPIVLEMLACGDVNLTTIEVLSPKLTPENRRELLSAARHKTRREVEELLAKLFPSPDIRSSIRKLPVAKVGLVEQVTVPNAAVLPLDGLAVAATGTDGGLAPDRLGATAVGSAAEMGTVAAVGCAAEVAAEGPRVKPRPGIIKPLAEDRYAIQFTASGAMHGRLRRLQELLRHQIPNGDLAQVIDRALILALEQVEKTRLGKTTRPRPVRQAVGPPRAKPDSRYIPAAVKRAVWKRDEGRCRFMGSNQRRCTEKARLQFHHVDPHGVGGPATIDNIELRCQAHNLYESEMFYGQRWIGRKQAPGGDKESKGAAKQSRRGGSKPDGGAGSGDGGLAPEPVG